MSFIYQHFFDRTDTDTIMAIAGGLLGAKYGFESISNEVNTSQNIKKVNEYFNTTLRPAFTEQLKESLNKFV
jgi:ADP-ribosylglycohydrolase